MSVGEAKAAAGRWVAAHGAKIAGFAGAYLAGSAAWLPDEATLPASSDVDIMVVLEAPEPPAKPGKFLYDRVLLEVSFLSRELLSTPELALSDYHLASSLRSLAILADPTGALGRLQPAVATEFGRREWVVRRCQHARERVLTGLGRISEDAPPHEQMLSWIFPTGVTTHILLTAGLRNPTVRTRYVAVRKLLAEHSQSDLYEPLLDLLGCAGMTREGVTHHLAALTPLFDVAATVSRTPFLFASDISPAARPIAIDGSRELIERGDHREAVFWIAVTHARCLTILAADAPTGTYTQFAAGLQAIRDDLGVGDFASFQQRRREVEAMLPRVWGVAESIIAGNPEVTGSGRERS